MFHFLERPFFGLHLICSPEQNRGQGSSPPKLKIGQNWDKTANYSPQYSAKIGTPEKQVISKKNRAKFFFWRSPVFHLIFTEKSPYSTSGTMKIWVQFGYGTTFQKILATCLFFTKVQSTLKKRPPMQNFTI